ncbi:type IV secretory pathway TrbF-like protein [Sphingomonas sp. SORGH_AS 950]|uniref:conjugal transfer protein TrbF n=1 Tax=Sphingomonas sp. SORGH_AS_0950 TaxID=3041792 RepID=UPI002782CB00|nr:conjugal transfer protein TrbF [Sphingomonas sp. SORGH_AS_0950]MDQ1158949.1 type IV secretory pathway TrbF-like protein [Sphingomonas sp. SORGH_AS_0950]
MIFKRNPQRYGRTPEPETPYQRAGQLWDDRIGSARIQAHNWRLIAFGCLTLAGGLAIGNVWQSLQSRVTPYVVEVDRLGEPRAVAPAIQNYRPTDAEVAWQLARFITDVRSVSTDPVLVKKNWLEAYDFVTDRAAQFLNDYARANDPFSKIGERSVSVQVTSVVRASDTSFQVKWIEQTYERGSLAGTTRWTAILSIVMRPPKNADSLRRNPLGLFVNAIDWTKELDSGGSALAANPTPTMAQPVAALSSPIAPVPTPTNPPSSNEGGNVQ